MGDIPLDPFIMKQIEEAEKNRKEGYYPVWETAYYFKLPAFVFEVPERKFNLIDWLTWITQGRIPDKLYNLKEFITNLFWSWKPM